MSEGLCLEFSMCIVYLTTHLLKERLSWHLPLSLDGCYSLTFVFFPVHPQMWFRIQASNYSVQE